MGELPGKMNRFAALLIAVLVLPSPALAEQKRPLVLIDDDVAPLPSTDTIGTRPNSPIDVADYMTAETVADVIEGTKTHDAKIGREACRERVGRFVLKAGGGGTVTKK